MSFLSAIAVCVLAGAAENPVVCPAEAHPELYTVEWTTPGAGSLDSMPLGNGDIGINLWAEDNGDIVFYIGKTDAWSGNGRLLKLGRVRLSVNGHTKGGESEKFSQTLYADRGVCEIRQGAPQDGVTTRVWVDAHYPAIRVEVIAEHDCTCRVTLETWRDEPRELRDEERHSAYGLIASGQPIQVEKDTIVEGAGDAVLWYHTNASSIYSATLARQGMGDWTESHQDPLLNRTFGGLLAGEGLIKTGARTLEPSTPARRHAFAIYALTTGNKPVSEWENEIESIRKNDATIWATAYERHQDWWADFWNRSWIRVYADDRAANGAMAEKLAELTRAYNLQRYVSACAGRGDYPIKFNGSIFNVDAVVDGQEVDADYRRWGGPYWFQNTRLIYWPMLASGDHEFMQPLFGMYRDMLPFAKARTRTYYGHDGAFFPETQYFWGAYAMDNYGWQRTEDMPPGLTENRYIRYYWSSGLELSFMMLDYFEHTGDEDFVRDTLVPIADAVAMFYDEHYPRDASGKMRIAPSQSLETYQDTVNPLPPIAGLRAVLPRLLALPRNLASEEQRARWDRLLESVPALPLTKTEEGDAILAPAGEVLEPPKNQENPALYAVFPYRLYGIGKPDIEIARRTYASRRVKSHRGWHQEETQAACLGLGEEAGAGLLERLSDQYRVGRFPVNWGPNFDWIPDQDHGSNILLALQHMLLQWDGDTLYTTPAWPAEWNVEFKLHALGGRVVEGVFAEGSMTYLTTTPPE